MVKLLIVFFILISSTAVSQSVYVISSSYDTITKKWNYDTGLIYMGNDSMYVSTKTHFLKVRFLGDIESAATNRDKTVLTLAYRQKVSMVIEKDTIYCTFETITHKTDFTGMFSLYTFDDVENKIIKRYFTYWVTPIKF